MTSPCYTPAPARLLIVEEALRGPAGHWPEYIRTIADGCRAAGDEVTVLAHREASPAILDRLQATPMLPYSAWDGIYQSPNPVVRYSGALLHNHRLYRSMASFFDDREKFDCVLAPTILIHHLLAWAKLARRYAGRKFDRLVLIFVNGQGIYQGPGKPVLFPRHPRRALFRRALRSIEPLVANGQVVLGAETDGMAREYEAFSGLPFQRFPHPVDFPEIGRDQVSHIPPVLSCLGFARHEKGSDLLQNAIAAVRRSRPDLKARFVIQWLEDFNDADGKPVTKDPALLADPDVEYITASIDTDRYVAELKRASAMLLPYRASSYYNRVSRVAIEAAIAGIPMLYTRDTWLEEMVRHCGAGVGFGNENFEELVAKIIFLIENIRSLNLRADAKREVARQAFSAGAFRHSLLPGRPSADPAPDPHPATHEAGDGLPRSPNVVR